MSVGEIQAVAVARARKTLRVPTRAILRVTVVAVVWGCFASWCLVVLRGEALLEAVKAGIWLSRVVSVYLGLLAGWVIYNKFLGPAKLMSGEERAFDKDYFGRPVAVASGAAFSDQHLVLEYRNDRKVYRLPDADAASDGLEVAVASDVKTLAAAVGARASAAPPSPSDEAKTEPHVRDL